MTGRFRGMWEGGAYSLKLCKVIYIHYDIRYCFGSFGLNFNNDSFWIPLHVSIEFIPYVYKLMFVVMVTI